MESQHKHIFLTAGRTGRTHVVAILTSLAILIVLLFIANYPAFPEYLRLSNTAQPTEWRIFRDLEAGLEIHFPADWKLINKPLGCDEINGCAHLSGPEGVLNIRMPELIDPQFHPDPKIEDYLKAPREISSNRIGGLPTIEQTDPLPFSLFEPEVSHERMVQETLYYVLVPPQGAEKIYRLFEIQVEQDIASAAANDVINKILIQIKFLEPSLPRKVGS